MSKLKTDPAPTFESYQFSPIAVVRSEFSDRFGVPRQPGLAPASRAVLKFAQDSRLQAALKNLEEFSHVWVLFVFHLRGSKDWKPGIRPPRLGGKRKVGVLSSRSPHRPNPIGLSAVRIEKVDLRAKGGAEIAVSGHDFVDGTPVLDIKPYLAYADSLPHAKSGWASEEIPVFPVSWESGVALPDTLRARAEEIIGLDPRPAFQKRKNPVGEPESVGLRFGIWVDDYDVRFEITSNGFKVIEVDRESPRGSRKKKSPK